MGNYPTGLLQEVDPWFNSTAFRSDHPAIIVMPLLDQTVDPSGSTINFGGVSTADTAGQDNALAALQAVMSQYSTDASRVYVTGNSMGGIGTEDMIIKYNAYTGTEGKIFAAGLSLAGADYGQGFPQPNQSVVTALKNVPFWAIHGGQDTTVPLTWDQNLYAAEQASGGDMVYTENANLGHDVWDTYYPQTGAGSPLGWLFSQSTGGTTPTPTATPSANDTVVKAGSAAAITDASGNQWTIDSAGHVAINGAADATTSGVVELAYVTGTVWQENGNSLWWGETKPNASWTLGSGTATSPLPPTVPPSPDDTVVKAGSAAAIMDTSGNKWTINSANQVVVNGIPDTTTSGVLELAYVSGTIWQENNNKLWWGETTPNASWSPMGGTAVSPVPATPTPTGTPTIGSGSDTIVLTMSEDADGPVGAVGRDAEFTLNVDGKQIGGLQTVTASAAAGQTVTASAAAGQTETFTFAGNFAPGQHLTTVTFANNSMIQGDKAAFNDGGDRNLYVNSVTYDGTAISSVATPVYQSPMTPPNFPMVVPGNAVFAVTDTTTVPSNAASTPSTTPAGVSFGSGADTLTLAMSEDPYLGDAQFTVAVDGKAVGGTFTTAAINWEGQQQQFALKGDWGPGPHTVTVNYSNDLAALNASGMGIDAMDRNLYVDGISYDSVTATGAPWELATTGSKPFSVPAGVTPTPAASPNDTVVYVGSPSVITDAGDNKWTITSGGQVAMNGTADATTAHVAEIAYVGQTVWQENGSGLWWGKTSATAAWSPTAGSGASPLPPPVTIAASQSSATVSQSQVSVVATAGNRMVFVSGSGDTINLAGGINTITDTGHGNTYVIPRAGGGYDKFTSDILNTGSTLDLRAALATTDWNGAASTLPNYLTVVDNAHGGMLSMARTSGGAMGGIATIGGTTTESLATLLAHALT